MTHKAISPLRRRLIEDMAIRRLSPDFSYRVGFRAAVTRLASKPMKSVVVVG